MASKYKGKYKGPDAFKGDAAAISAWKKAGSPKNIAEFLKTRTSTKPAFKGKYPGPDEFEGDESAIAGWKAAGKDDLYTQAWGLSKSKYAPTLKELEMNAGTNTKLYTSSSQQRKAAIDREIGSINAAGATSKKTIGDLGAGNQSMYQQAVAQSQSNTKELLSKVDQNNSNLLSTLQAEIKARGGSPEDYAYLSPLTRQVAQTGETLAAVGEMNRGGLERQAGMDQTRTTTLQSMADMMATTGESTARGNAQRNMEELYNNWLAQNQSIETAKAKTDLEKADYTTNTYLTLKDKQQQAAAEAAALQMEYGFKNQQLAQEGAIAGARLSETQRHNMMSEQAAKDRISMSSAQFEATYGLSREKFDYEKAKDAASGGSSGGTPKGFNAANKYMEQALAASGFKPNQAAAILAGIKNKTPQMADGQGYSRASKEYLNLLTGGGSAKDLDAYISRLVKYSGVGDTPANRSKIQSYLNQYALIGGKKA